MNALGLPNRVAERLAAQLNAHLASLFSLREIYRRHRQYAREWKLWDADVVLSKSCKEMERLSALVTRRIVLLGGMPMTESKGQRSTAYLDPDPEGCVHVGSLLELDFRRAREMLRRLRETIHLAAELDDPGTEYLLKRILLRLENDASDLAGIAKVQVESGQTLVVDRASWEFS